MKFQISTAVFSTLWAKYCFHWNQSLNPSLSAWVRESYLMNHSIVNVAVWVIGNPTVLFQKWRTWKIITMISRGFRTLVVPRTSINYLLCIISWSRGLSAQFCHCVWDGDSKELESNGSSRSRPFVAVKWCYQWVGGSVKETLGKESLTYSSLWLRCLAFFVGQLMDPWISSWRITRKGFMSPKIVARFLSPSMPQRRRRKKVHWHIACSSSV